MEIKGYCTIRREAKSGLGDKLETFIGKDCRVVEFSDNGDVLVLNSEATALAMFDAKDVYRKFECDIFEDVICPPNMEEMHKMAYYSRVITRKGGYNNLLKSMVIQASLSMGKFHDSFLFQNQ